MRSFCSALVITAMVASSAIAAPLTPGKPAGVNHAQMGRENTGLILAGVGIVGLGIALVVSAGSGNNVTATTTPPTGTTTTTTVTTTTTA